MNFWSLNGTRQAIRHHRPDVHCFQRLDKPPGEQLSDLPEEAEPNVGYFVGARPVSRSEVGGRGAGGC
jgi:hypothetical protein